MEAKQTAEVAAHSITDVDRAERRLVVVDFAIALIRQYGEVILLGEMEQPPPIGFRGASAFGI